MRIIPPIASLLAGTLPLAGETATTSDFCRRLSENLDADRTVVMPGYRSGHVVIGAGRLHFYSAPSKNCKTEVFVVPGDNVDVVEEYGGFAFATYVNLKTGGVFQGWLESARLKPGGYGVAPRQ